MSDPEKSFCWPLRRLENERLILEPFQPSTDAEAYVQGTKDSPDFFKYLDYGPLSTGDEFIAIYKSMSPEDTMVFSILARSDSEQTPKFAGVIALLYANPNHGTVEIGIAILPAFQRTFVTSNAIGLLLMYTLDLPPQGLGLRRVQWQSNAKNEASRRVAARMGFTFECVQRFQRVVPRDKVGNDVDVSHLPGDLGPSRDTAVYSHYCDEWSEKRKEVVKVMERR